MQESIIIKPSVEKQFEHFMRQGRVLFFSAPCGFGKTVLADALLRGRNVLRQSAADPDCAILPSAQDWDILLIDDLQLMQEIPEQNKLIVERGLRGGSSCHTHASSNIRFLNSVSVIRTVQPSLLPRRFSRLLSPLTKITSYLRSSAFLR